MVMYLPIFIVITLIIGQLPLMKSMFKLFANPGFITEENIMLPDDLPYFTKRDNYRTCYLDHLSQ